MHAQVSHSSRRSLAASASASHAHTHNGALLIARLRAGTHTARHACAHSIFIAQSQISAQQRRQRAMLPPSPTPVARASLSLPGQLAHGLALVLTCCTSTRMCLKSTKATSLVPARFKGAETARAQNTDGRPKHQKDKTRVLHQPVQRSPLPRKGLDAYTQGAGRKCNARQWPGQPRDARARQAPGTPRAHPIPRTSVWCFPISGWLQQCNNTRPSSHAATSRRLPPREGTARTGARMRRSGMGRARQPYAYQLSSRSMPACHRPWSLPCPTPSTKSSTLDRQPQSAVLETMNPKLESQTRNPKPADHT